MSNIVLFGAQGAKLPAYLANRTELAKAINADVAGASGFPVLSIKGKVFTLVKGSEKKILTRPDDPDEVLQSLNLTVVRANKNSRVFYAKAYSEDDADGAKPTCYSGDGVAPAADAREPQAKKCQLCPHAVWGSKAGDSGKGTACSVNTRLAVVDPENVGEPWLLRVPAGSRANFADACKVADTRGLPYNAVVLKVSFDKEAPAPKLVFKPIGLVGDDSYSKVQALYETDEVKEIVGMIARRGAEEAEVPKIEADELDAAMLARDTTAKAAGKPVKAPQQIVEDDIDEVVEKPAKPAAKAKPVAEELSIDDIEEVAKPAKPAAKVKPAAEKPAKAAATSDMSDLLGDLDALLGDSDD